MNQRIFSYRSLYGIVVFSLATLITLTGVLGFTYALIHAREMVPLQHVPGANRHQIAVHDISGDPLPLRYAELIVPVLGSGAFFVAMVIGLIGQFRARLELDESRIRSINWSGKTVVDESLANVARLQFMIQGDMMTNYVIWFASGKRIVMGAVNDRDALIELVQERTGKRFE